MTDAASRRQNVRRISRESYRKWSGVSLNRLHHPRHLSTGDPVHRGTLSMTRKVLNIDSLQIDGAMHRPLGVT